MSITSRARRALGAILALGVTIPLIPLGAPPAAAAEPELAECTTFFLNQTEDFDWANPANWSTLSVPGVTDVACIDDVAVSGTDARVGTLRGTGMLTVVGGTFGVTGSTALGSIEIQGGELQTGGPATVASFAQSAGVLGGAGTLTVSSSFEWSGGSQAGPGATHLLPGASAVIHPNGAALTWGARELAADAVVHIAENGSVDFGAARARFAELAVSGVLVDVFGTDTHVFGGSLDDAAVSLPVGNQLTGTWSLVNASTLTVDGSIITGSVTLDASSELRIYGDSEADDETVTTLDASGSIAGAGLLSVTTGGGLIAYGPVEATSLRNSGVVAMTAAATFSDITSAGELLLEQAADVTASTVVVDAQGRVRVADTATLRVPEDGGGVQMASGRLEIAGVIVGDVAQAGGEVDVDGSASIRGAFTQSAGTMRVHGDPTRGFTTLGVDGPVSVAGTLWLVADGVVQQEAPVIIGQTVTGQFAELVAGESCADTQYEADRVIVRSTACPQVDSIAASEGDGLATIGVSIAEPLAAPYTATYETVDGSAVAGEDYVAATGAVTIAPGDTTAAIEIALVDDETVESDEAFGVTIVGPNTAAVGIASIDVVDDDDRAGLDYFYEFAPIIFGPSSAMGISSTTAVGIIPGPDAETYGSAWTYGIADGHLARLDWVGGDIVQDVNEAGSVLADRRVREPNGTIRSLQIPPGSEWFETRALADDGTVSGWAVYPTDPSTLDYRLVRWAPDGTPTVLTAGVEGLAVHGNDINNHGVIAGTVIEIENRQVSSVRAFRYDDANGLVVLPSLEGNTSALAINDGGEIVGRSGDHAVRWTAEGEIVDLGPGSAYDINNAGLIVGSAPSDSTWLGRAAVAWNETGRHELSDFAFGVDQGWIMTDATMINDRGDIVGGGYTEFSELTFALRLYDCVICVQTEFVEAQVADPATWTNVLGSTIEGNPVRLRAELTNQINDVAEIDVTVIDTLTGEPVDEAITLVLGANGGRQTIEVDIDTDGMAWSNGTKADPRQFEIEIRRAGTNVVYERAVATLTVNPRPLVLVHGLWSDASTWDLYPSMMRNAHPDWLVVPVTTMSTGGPAPKTIDQNAFEVEAAIEPIRVISNAWQVDIVGHSMGGLIGRSYIQNLMPSPVSPLTGEAVPAVRRLVMLGTPNLGSPCANMVPSRAAYELRPDVMRDFNARTTRRFGVEFSVAVGQHLPFTCLAALPGDDVVPEISAAWGITDAVDIADMPHTSMTSSPTLFNDFVMPRLTGTVIGGAGDMATLAAPATADETIEAAEAAPEFPAVQGLYFADSVLDSGAVTAVGLNVPASASHVGVVIAARDIVSAELVDHRGVVQATLAAATPASDHPAFRTLVAPASAGRWILRVRNTGAEVEAVSIGAAAPGTPIDLSLTAQQSHWSGRVRVTATLDTTAIERPARLEAAVHTPTGDTSIDLYDDGLHRDGGAGDGVYAGVAENLPDGLVTATVQMILPNFMRAATSSTVVTIPDTPPANSTPIATPATVAAERGVAIPVPLTGIDLDDDELTVTIVDGPDHGNLVQQSNRWVYTSAADYTGTDTVTFTVSDGRQVSAPATVTIVVDHSPVLLTNDGATTAAQHQTVRLAAKITDPYTGAWVPGTTVRFELGGTSWTAVSGQSTTVVDPEPQLDLAPGSYVLTITAEATDRFAASTIRIPFTVTGNQAPEVSFDGREGDEAGYPIWFGASVDDPDDTHDVVAAEWDFDGDGTVDQHTGAALDGSIWTTHTYPDTATGTFAPTVTVIDRAGNRASATLAPFDLLPHAPLGSLRMVRADERSMTPLGIDDSGRYVLGAAYTPGSSNPVRRRLEVVDRTTGTAEVVSIDPSGQTLDAEIGVISPDGRYVAFSARSAADTYGQVYLRDLSTDTTELVSRRGTSAGSGRSIPVALSADAGRVLFTTAANDLAGGCGAGCDSLVVWTRATGALELVSVVDGVAVDGEQGDLSVDGTHVAVRLRPPGNGYEQIYVRDLATGSTTLASATPAGQPGNGPNGSPRLDGDGSTVLFVTSASDLVAGDSNNRSDVVVRELSTSTSRLVAPLATSAGSADLSTDGSTAAVVLRGDPATGESLTATQVYAIGLGTGEARLLSRSTRTGAASTAGSVLPFAPGLLSGNGACVVFASMDNGLVPGDVFDIDGTVTNGLGKWYDTFVDEAGACTGPTNHAPIAQDADAATDEDTSVDMTIEAADADGDELTFTIVDGPTNGTLDGTAPTYRYTPNPDWHGTDTVTFTASDGLATSQVATVTITVRPVDEPPTPECTFGGFTQPVDNAPTVNTVKAGANVPLKFTYCADGRLAIFAAGSPASAAHVCGAGATDALEETGQPGASTLTFDPATGRYHYNWKTEKSWKGQCRTLVFTFVDGTSVTAEFKFT